MWELSPRCVLGDPGALFCTLEELRSGRSQYTNARGKSFNLFWFGCYVHLSCRMGSEVLNSVMSFYAFYVRCNFSSLLSCGFAVRYFNISFCRITYNLVPRKPRYGGSGGHVDGIGQRIAIPSPHSGSQAPYPGFVIPVPFIALGINILLAMSKLLGV